MEMGYRARQQHGVGRDWNAGLQLKLKNTEDTWDIYDLRSKGLPIPGTLRRGGCTVAEDGDRVIVRAYCGPRNLRVGEELLFRFGCSSRR